MEKENTKATSVSEGKPVARRETNVDLAKLTPYYVTALATSHVMHSDMFLIAFFSGMSLPAEEKTSVLMENLVSTVALDFQQAKYLHDFLTQYIEAVEAKRK